MSVHAPGAAVDDASGPCRAGAVDHVLHALDVDRAVGAVGLPCFPVRGGDVIDDVDALAGCGHRRPAVFGSACTICSTGVLRPDVVWFGERPYEMGRIERTVQGAQTFVAIGTSGEVYPAAGLVDTARSCGVETVEMNLERTSPSFTRAILGPATQTVPAFVAELVR